MSTPLDNTSQATHTRLLLNELPFSELYNWVYTLNMPQLPPPDLAGESLLGWSPPGPFDFYGDPTAMDAQDGDNGYGEDGQTLRLNVATTADHEQARWEEAFARAWSLPVVIPAAAGHSNLAEGLTGSNVGVGPQPAAAAAGHEDLQADIEPPDASNGELDAEVGHHAQQYNTLATPGQSQNATSKIMQPAPGNTQRPRTRANLLTSVAGKQGEPKRQPRASAAPASVQAEPSRKRGRPSTTNVALADERGKRLQSTSSSMPASGDARASQKRGRPSAGGEGDEHRAAKRLKDGDNGATAGLDGGDPKIPFEQSPVGLLCAQRGISKKIKPWIPIPCFVCAEHPAEEGELEPAEDGELEPAEPKTFAKWSSFRRHILRCAADRSEWPICHFCGKPRNAHKRPDLMARHVVGLHGYAPCRKLQRVIRRGVKTNGELVDWLAKRNLPIDERFLGKNLATALRLAAQEKPVGRDERHLIPLRPVRGRDDEDDEADEASDLSDAESMDE